ncbi:adenine phosphoribosyltransferase [candidate division KSB1 bacterium]
MDIKKMTRVVQDFPKPGIGFFDITTVLKDKDAFKQVIDTMSDYFKDHKFTKIAGTEARGFVYASALAYKMNKGLILIRKPGKLPADTYKYEYSLEYGSDAVEMHKDAVENGENILVIDDLLATGGTIDATCKLIEKAGGIVAGVGFMIELDFLKGRDKIDKYDVFSILNISDE